MSASPCDHGDKCAANTDRRPRSWWGVNETKPFEIGIRLPWFNRHRPYIALHVSQWGYAFRDGKSRRILHVQLMWGRLFTDRGGFKVWTPHGTAE